MVDSDGRMIELFGQRQTLVNVCPCTELKVVHMREFEGIFKCYPCLVRSLKMQHSSQLPRSGETARVQPYL